MKKISLVLMACALVALASCGNKKKAAQQEPQAQDEFQVQQLEANIQMQLDSIAAIFNEKSNGSVMACFDNGTIELSESEKLIKPAYLTDPEATAQLATLAQKYRAIAVLFIDSKVAGLYDMPQDAYTAAITKLASDINDPAFRKFNENPIEDLSQSLTAFYQDEVQNGRINLFWELNATAIIESLYIMSQNTDKFLSMFTDDDAANFTLRLFLAKQSVDQLVAYYPELESMANALAPLDVLNAMDVEEFKSQLLEMKGQLEVIRQGLLK